MGKVLLIGGSPMIGKSAIARKLASSFGLASYSTNDIGEMLQTVVDINPMKENNFLEYFNDSSLRELIDDIRVYHKNMEPALARLIEIHASAGNSIVLEGYALYPHILEKCPDTNVEAIWLVAEEKVLKTALKESEEFAEASHTAIKNYLQRSIWHNTLIKKECKMYDCKYIVVNGKKTMDELIEEILEITEYEA